MYCVRDDRRSHLAALQLSVASILRHAPGSSVVASVPALSADERAWFARRPGVEVLEDEQFSGAGWNVKPELLLRRLERFEDVVWWDSDVLAAADPTDLLEPRRPGALVVAEDTWWAELPGGSDRTRAWGLPVGRVLPFSVNSGILRVDRSHRPLLEHWRELLDRPDYRHAQSLGGHARPLHMLGDQEVLSALLGSTAHAGIPVQPVPRGTGIAQCWGPAGFTPAERVRVLRGGGPVLVHSIVTKPWRYAGPDGFAPLRLGLRRTPYRQFWAAIHAEMSPYTVVARDLRDELAERPPWLWSRSRTGRLLDRLPGNRLAAPGLPLAVVDAGMRHVERRRRPIVRPATV